VCEERPTETPWASNRDRQRVRGVGRGRHERGAVACEAWQQCEASLFHRGETLRGETVRGENYLFQQNFTSATEGEALLCVPSEPLCDQSGVTHWASSCVLEVEPATHRRIRHL
jgi:hypothetical protein